MPLVSSEKLLLDAQKNGYAVGAFNVENMEMIQAVIKAAEDMNSPVILQSTPSTVRYAGLNLLFANVKSLAETSRMPVALHLDHGDSFELAVQAIRQGYTSVMIDGSKLSFEENINLTKRVVDVAKPNNIPVEAELGKIGGKEDDLQSEPTDLFTDPVQCAEFAERTGISSVAIAIGTAHGFYNGVPELQIERLKEIRKKVSIPLVLHGASGLSDEAVKEAVKEGICKVNFATELRVAYSDGVKKVISEDENTYDPKGYGKLARERVYEIVKSRIKVVGSDNRFLE